MTSALRPPDDADHRRRAVLDVAATVLAAEGPQGLSLRRVAALAGGSTQLVYTLFGGKPGLADALYAEGFARLAAAMSTSAGPARDGDPEQLVRLGAGYRRFALEEPALFSVMFGRALSGFVPHRATRATGREATFGQVVAAVRRSQDAGRLRAGDPEELARLCWTTAHGLAALEHAGLLGAGETTDAFADRALRLPVDALRT